MEVGLAQVVHDNPVEGDQEYEVAPAAVSVPEALPQKEGAGGVTVIVGMGFTVIVCVVELLPFALVAVSVIVYVPALL